MKILFLDDDKTRVEQFEQRTGLKVCHVMNGEDFVREVNNSSFDVIMLDHDLQLPDWDGAKAAKYLAENRGMFNEQRVIIHSANSVGVANMMSHMKHADHLLVDVIWWAWSRASYDATNGLAFSL